MISRVFGKCNNQDIVFTLIDGRRWETIVPRHLNGIYYLDLYAEDEAGNIGFIATAIATYNSEDLSFKFELINYQENYNIDCYDVDDSKAIEMFIETFKCRKFILEERNDDKCASFKVK